MVHFQGQTVSFREGLSHEKSTLNGMFPFLQVGYVNSSRWYLYVLGIQILSQEGVWMSKLYISHTFEAGKPNQVN